MKRFSLKYSTSITPVRETEVTSVPSTYIGYFARLSGFIHPFTLKNSWHIKLTCVAELLLAATLRSFLTPPPKSIAHV
jgi:hypothetical protein